MEKSWENFWTTGKVEDYLTYRNRVEESESVNLQERKSDGNTRADAGKDEGKSIWKGFM